MADQAILALRVVVAPGLQKKVHVTLFLLAGLFFGVTLFFQHSASIDRARAAGVGFPRVEFDFSDFTVRDESRNGVSEQKSELKVVLDKELSASKLTKKGTFSFVLGDFLTLDTKTKERRDLSIARELMTTAARNAEDKNTADLQRNLSVFENYINASPNPVVILDNEIGRFGFFSFKYNEPLWRIEQFLRHKLFERSLVGDTKSALWLIHQDLLDSYDASVQGDEMRALALFQSFGERLITVEALENDALGQYSAILQSEAQSVRDLLVQHAFLIRADTVDILLSLNNRILSMTTANDKPAYRDKVIVQYLDVLETIKSLLSKAGNDAEELIPAARAVSVRLSAQIGLLKVDGGASPAAMAQADSRLLTLSSFLEFLSSQSSFSLHGAFDDELDKFVKKAGEFAVIQNIVSKNAKSSDQGQTGLSETEILEKAASALNAVEVKSGQIAVSDAKRGMVSIQGAEFLQTALGGEYDVEREIFTVLILNGERIERAVSLKNLRQFVVAYLGKSSASPQAAVQPESQTADAAQTNVNRIARVFAQKELAGKGITVDAESVGVEDAAAAVFSVEGAKWQDNEGVYEASFLWESATGLIANVRIQTALGQLPVNEITTLEDLLEKGVLIVKRAELEKQRLEEFEENLGESASQ